ncbi:MAG: hypothetical protein HRT72_05550, partial [Flavobacteriales bacterium]|nr:hypothetical protein [Flavobacteriales bacterium]
MYRNLKINFITAIFTLLVLPFSLFAGTDLPRSLKITHETTQTELDQIVNDLLTNEVKLELSKTEFNKKKTKLINLAGTLQYNDIDKTGFEFEAFKIESVV